MALSEIENFWEVFSFNKEPTQLERYEERNSPECIKKFIAIGGGVRMGTTLEKYARFHFKTLLNRKGGKKQTGHDHIIKLDKKEVLVEQKSCGHWGYDDYKWQHIATNHPWKMLLLCGIDYTAVKFWGMDRKTYERLISEGAITNQGDKDKNSSQGLWLEYSKVKNSLVEIDSDEQLLKFAASAE